MKVSNTKTSFKIGGSVGIIILLLGFTILFGVYQMSQVSEEIVEISQEYGPLDQLVKNIQMNQLTQAVNLEIIVNELEEKNYNKLEQAKEEFWESGGKIKSDFIHSKEIAQNGYSVSISENKRTDFELIYDRLSKIEQIHQGYENTARELFVEEKTNQNFELLFQKTKEIQAEFYYEIDAISNQLRVHVDESTTQIESHENTLLTAQIIIVSIVGLISSMLGFFINRINKDLKKEIKEKTRELASANEKLRKLDEKKNEFIGIASHELKSPIQPIFGFAELAKSGDINQNEAWDGVTDLAKKLQNLANDVLDVSKIESNRLELHKQAIPINELILRIVRELSLDLKEVKIQTNLDENIELEIDQIRIEQVLRNLLSNAVKFTQKGTIKIVTHVNHEKGILQIKVSDSGLGIPESVLPSIFEKFVTKTHGVENISGTGLGLFVCRGIIESHGGKIFAYNNSDRGATFEFTLPLVIQVPEGQNFI